MKPPSKQEAPIVRGDGANKNGEFQGRARKVPECRNGRALMHPSRPLGAGLGCWPSGQRAPRAFGSAARPAVALGRRAFSAPFRLSARQAGARALAPRLRQKQRTRRSSCSQTHVSIVSGRVTETSLFA